MGLNLAFAVGHLQLTCCTACTQTVPALTLLWPPDVVALAERADAVRQGHTAVQGHAPCSPTANGCCSRCWQPEICRGSPCELSVGSLPLRRYLLYQVSLPSSQHRCWRNAFPTKEERRRAPVWIFSAQPAAPKTWENKIFRVLERVTFPSESPCHPITYEKSFEGRSQLGSYSPGRRSGCAGLAAIRGHLRRTPFFAQKVWSRSSEDWALSLQKPRLHGQGGMRQVEVKVKFTSDVWHRTLIRRAGLHPDLLQQWESN